MSGRRWVNFRTTKPFKWQSCEYTGVKLGHHYVCKWYNIAEYKIHDDVIKWNHFPRYWSFVPGIHRSPVNSPHKGQWRGALMFSLIYASIYGWVNNREAGDLRRHRAHYDVTTMFDIWFPVPLCLPVICSTHLLTKPNYSNDWRVPVTCHNNLILYIIPRILTVKWRIYTPVNNDIIGSDDGLWSDLPQAIGSDDGSLLSDH